MFSSLNKMHHVGKLMIKMRGFLNLLVLLILLCSSFFFSAYVNNARADVACSNGYETLPLSPGGVCPPPDAYGAFTPAVSGSNPTSQDISQATTRTGGMSVDEFTCTLSKNIINPLLILLTVGALIVFVWGMIEFLLAIGRGSEDKSAGKMHMLWGIIGLLVIVAAYAIIQMVVFSLGASLYQAHC